MLTCRKKKGLYQPYPELSQKQVEKKGMEKLSAYSKGDWIETYTGRQFRPFDPRPEDVCIEDIAHALSLLCRFNGQCRYFYSVGQHSLLCSELAHKRGLGKRMELLMLLHDASEAYVSDVARPIKPFLNNFKDIEHKVQRAILDAFVIKEPSKNEMQLIKEIDLTLLATEARILMPFKNWELPYPPTDIVTVCERKASHIKDSFMERFFDLIKETEDAQNRGFSMNRVLTL